MIHGRSITHRTVTASLVAVILALIVAACGSGNTGLPGESVAPTTGGGGPGPQDTGRPASGAKARIVNLYVPGKGEPGPVDVYLKPYALEGDTPAFSIPYGEIGAFFDPASDTDGNVFVSVYRQGETGNGTSIMSWTDTVTSGDITTNVLGTGENLDENGDRFGQLWSFDHGPAGQLPSPSAGDALLVANATALENVVPDARDSYLFLSTGQGCRPAYFDTESSQGLLGRQLEYQLPLATTSLSIYKYPPDTGLPDCGNAPLLADVPIALAADWPVALLIYAPKAGDYRTMLVPLEP